MIICSKEGEDKSHMVSKLMLHKKSLFLKHSDEECRDYLKRHFSSTATEDQLHASVIDIERYNVNIISQLSLINIFIILLDLMFVSYHPIEVVWAKHYMSREWLIS